MKLERLIVGWFTVPAGVVRSGDDMERRIRCPIPAYLVDTGAERILVDTGLHPQAVSDQAVRYGSADATGPFRLELEQSLTDQVDADALDRVVLTHLHFDHAGGLGLLPSSLPVVVQRREWEAAHDPAAVERNFFHRADYESVADRVVLVDGDHDLLGDGSVRLLLTPGHTPGHQSVAVGETLVIGGDVVHFASGLDDKRFPVFADDFEAQAASAERLRELRDSGRTILPGHDPDLLTAGPVAVAQ